MHQRTKSTINISNSINLINPVYRPDGKIINALTFDIEDWFHLIEIEGLDDRSTWSQRETIVEDRTDFILEILSSRNVKATFFILGWIAERYPSLIRRIADQGHELGTHSYWHQPVYTMTPEEFKRDIQLSISVIENSAGVPVVGFRAPSFSITPGTEWAFDILGELGIKYDASLFPAVRGHGGYLCERAPHYFSNSNPNHFLPELPMSVMNMYGATIGFSGGGYLRAFPLWMIRNGFNQVHKLRCPVVVYLHPRDFALNCPSVPMPPLRKFKSYNGIATTYRKFNYLLDSYHFETCGSVLGIDRLRNLPASQTLDKSISVQPARLNRSLKVLLLNQAFWPDVVATAQHADDLATYLSQNGDEVSVVASRSIYGTRNATLPKREMRYGINIYRVGLQLFGKRGITPRVFDFTLFYIAALWRCMILPRHDVVICFTTPPFIALVGVLLKWIKGTRLVYWTMDLYPEVAGAAGVMKSNGALWNIFRWVDRICLRQSDRVVALGDYMKQKVIQKGAAPTRVSTISVWSGAEKFARRNRQDNPLRTEWNIGDRFTVLYVGNFGLGHDMDAIAGAVEKLKDDDSIRWLFIGDGKAKPNLERRISECGAKNIFVSGYQTRGQLADVLDLGDTHLVTLLPGWEGLILPSKFFSVLAAGKPVLWVGPENSECVTILNENQCGYQSKPGDGDALAREIQYLSAHRSDAQEMGRRGQVAYEMKYESQHACKAWQDVLHAIVRPL
jgi:polysaccharide deacetylase family protein (PEP-CTERM system associated)